MARRGVQIPNEVTKVETSLQNNSIENLENMVSNLIKRWDKYDKVSNEKFNDINNALQGNITYIDNKIDKNINNLNDKINENINYLNNQINNNVKDFLNKPSLFKRIVSWVKKKVFKINE